MSDTFAALSPRDRLIVPLDVPSVDDAQAIITDLGDTVSFYKIGYQLGYAGGFELARRLVSDGKDMFMDLKLLDIDNTVEKGVTSICQIGAKFLTIHAYPKAMRAAVTGRGKSSLQLLGVTVLTSMDDVDLSDAGYGKSAEELVTERAKDARLAGMDGIVCSALEGGKHALCGWTGLGDRDTGHPSSRHRYWRSEAGCDTNPRNCVGAQIISLLVAQFWQQTIVRIWREPLRTKLFRVLNNEKSELLCKKRVTLIFCFACEIDEQCRTISRSDLLLLTTFSTCTPLKRVLPVCFWIVPILNWQASHPYPLPPISSISGARILSFSLNGATSALRRWLGPERLD